MHLVTTTNVNTKYTVNETDNQQTRKAEQRKCPPAPNAPCKSLEENYNINHDHFWQEKWSSLSVVNCDHNTPINAHIFKHPAAVKCAMHGCMTELAGWWLLTGVSYLCTIVPCSFKRVTKNTGQKRKTKPVCMCGKWGSCSPFISKAESELN